MKRLCLLISILCLASSVVGCDKENSSTTQEVNTIVTIPIEVIEVALEDSKTTLGDSEEVVPYEDL